MAKTQKMLRKTTVSHNEQDIILTENVIFSADSESYEIFANEVVGVGGESQVYMARRISDGSPVLAKVYTEFSYGGKAAQDRDAILKFLMKSSDYKKTHLLPLYAAGDIMTNSGKRPVDIIPNCPDGHLVQCDFDELAEKVVPGILTALGYMHRSNLVHRDIKPENIYLFNGEVVIGDFGTAGRLSSGVGVTTTRRGTVGYTAPEVGGGFFVVPSDYFAFGCTIATLYKGSHVYSHLVDNQREGEFLFTVKQNGLPLDCPPAHQSLQTLVDALTLFDTDERANYDDVQLWIDAPAEFYNVWKNCRSKESEASYFSYEFERNTYHTRDELTAAFLAKWEAAKGDFYRGGARNSKFLNFLVRSNQDCVDDAGKILEGYDRDRTGKYDLDFGFAKLLHFFNSSHDDNGHCPIYWCGYVFNSLSDISIMMANDSECKEKLVHLLTSGFLSWKLKNTEDYNDEASVAVIEKIETISKEYPDLAFYLLMYRLAPASLFELETPDTVFDKLISSSRSFFTNANTVLQDDNNLARLVSAGFEDQVLNFKRRLTTDHLKNVTELYRLFETVCEQKGTVRKHFYSYGPYSYLYWIQQNLALYSFNSDSARRNAEQIGNVTFSDETSIDELIRRCVDLKEGYYKNLLDDFQNDILLAYMGVETDKEISSKNIDAYFVEGFFGNSVPVGFMRYIGMDEPTSSEPLNDSRRNR